MIIYTGVNSVSDRAVVLWSVKHLDQKEHKNLRVNVEYDHATLVRWSPDSKAFIIHKSVENVVEVHKGAKKPDGWIGPVTKAITFPKVINALTLLAYNCLCS